MEATRPPAVDHVAGHTDDATTLPWYDEILRSAGLDPAAVARIEPLRAGLGGGRLWRLWLTTPITRAMTSTPAVAHWSARRIVKVIAPLNGWLSVATADAHVREVSLWSSGLLTGLPRSIETGVVAWQAGRQAAPGGAIGQAGQAWSALLMRDETARLWRRPLRTPPGRLPAAIVTLLDDLARLHARFWNDPRLDDTHTAAIGLTPLRETLLLAAPAMIAERLAVGDPNPYLPLARAGWAAFFALADPDAAATLQQALVEPEPYVEAIAALPRTLIHGDVWGPNLGRLPPTYTAPRLGARTLLLDWALAAAAPATFDPLWLCGVWQTLDPHRILGAYRARLARHLAARGVALPAGVWRSLADAGYLRTALTCGEAFGRAAREAPAGAARRQAERRARWWAARAAVATQRLRMAQL